jgi:hypothetical protein
MIKFAIKEYPDRLIIKQNTSSILLNIGMEIIGLVLTLLVLLFPYDQLIELHKFAWLVYLLPVFQLIRVIVKSMSMFKGLTFELNKTRNQLLKNDRIIDQLSNITKIEWNIDSASDHEESYLELRSANQVKHRISVTLNYMNKEHLELGKRIAKFLKVEFHNNNPLEKEIIYFGQNNLNESELDFIENKMTSAIE